jgi:AraC-like DNA-binding protein
VSIAALEQLATRAAALTGEPGLGFYLGLQVPVSSHGFVGFAAMASPTLGEALDVAVRFAPTRTNAIALRAQTGGGAASVVLEELAPLGAARELLVCSMLVGLQHAAEALTGKRMEGSADFALPEPPHAARFRHLIRGGMRFGQPAHQIVFDASALALPVVMADPVALRLARDQCQRELDEIGAGASAAARVRAFLNEPRREGAPAGLDETARALGLSARTLKRRLADEGTDFSTLLDDQKRQRALLLLRSADLSVEDVAARVGYSDVANFTRAFRRWAGTTPTAYRRAEQKGRRSAG